MTRSSVQSVSHAFVESMMNDFHKMPSSLLRTLLMRCQNGSCVDNTQHMTAWDRAHQNRSNRLRISEHAVEGRVDRSRLVWPPSLESCI